MFDISRTDFLVDAADWRERAQHTLSIYYGDEATLDYAYGDVCLVVHVLGKARFQHS